MIRFGLTGGIGSGKTTAARIFELLDVPVYNSDERARLISDNDNGTVRSVTELFGPEAYIEGSLNRPFIASLVFNDRDLLQQLNGIIHPALRSDYEAWVKQHADAPYIIMESAILIEAGFTRDVDKIIVVSAPEQLRILRTMRRDSVSAADVRKRINAQLDDKSRLKYADYIISTDEKELLIPRIIRLHEHILSGK